MKAETPNTQEQKPQTFGGSPPPPTETEELQTALSDLYRLIIRKSNQSPEIFIDTDYQRMKKAKDVLTRYAPPFDASQVLRKSNQQDQ